MYATGHIKHLPAENLVAIRTIFPEDAVIGNKAWLVGTPHRGASFLKTSDVEEWDDLYIPPTPE